MAFANDRHMSTDVPKILLTPLPMVQEVGSIPLNMRKTED